MCRFTVPTPHFWSAAEGFPAGQSEKVTTQFFEICSDHRQKKTRSAENQLKMRPKLSTACSHTAQLDKVLSMNFLQNYLNGFRTTYLTQSVKRSVCPKQKVHTSLSHLSHSTAKVKPHYPPPDCVPDPTFTSGHKAWSPGSTVVCHLTVPP